VAKRLTLKTTGEKPCKIINLLTLYR